jgi:hypothetical protein
MSNREERERLRQQRLAQQSSAGSADRRRLFLGYALAGLLAAAVLAGLVAVITSGGNDDGSVDTSDIPENARVQAEVGVFKGLEFDDREGTPPPEIQFGDLEESAREAGCELMLDLDDEGSTHFDEEKEGTYKTNPPTSGDHFASPTEAGSGAIADGAYLSSPLESRAVHAMEHGRVLIRYAPDLPEEQQLALKGVFDENPDGVIMFPDPDLPYDVAVSAWTNAIGCKTYDPLVLDVVRNFRDTFRGNGPENVPITF